jgi:hypothetical protein
MKIKQTLAVLIMGTTIVTAGAYADDEDTDGEQAKIRRGFEIAPVPLNLEHKNWRLVGLGSYLVNAVGSCNICHSAGPSTEYTPSGNPYHKGSPPTVINQATYLGGGRAFPAQAVGAPIIVSRNLTPDKTGRPEGGRSFEEFRHVMRTGEDVDHVHPNCSEKTAAAGTCFPDSLPFNGDLLQIMPWPSLRHMTDHDLRAIYEYLKAIPCIAGPPTGVLHNDCT